MSKIGTGNLSGYNPLMSGLAKSSITSLPAYDLSVSQGQNNAFQNALSLPGLNTNGMQSAFSILQLFMLLLSTLLSKASGNVSNSGFSPQSNSGPSNFPEDAGSSGSSEEADSSGGVDSSNAGANNDSLEPTNESTAVPTKKRGLSNSTGLNHAVAVRKGDAGKPSSVEQFSQQLGGKNVLASDALDTRNSAQEDIMNAGWLLDPYSKWKGNDPNKKLVLAVPMLQKSEEGQLAAGASGAFDDRFRKLARDMKSKGLGDSVIRLGWEANGDWMPWAAGKDPTAFKAYYKRIATIMKQEAPDLKFSFDANIGQTPIEQIYPGDDVVDFVGADAYDGFGVQGSDQERWNEIYSGKNGLAHIRNFAAAHGKQMSIPEWGLSARGGDSTYFMQNMIKFINESDIAFHSYFNVPGGGVNTTLEQNPKSYQLYRQAFGR